MSIGVVRNVRNKFASRHPLSALAATKRKHILAGNSPETPGPDNEEEKPPGAFATVSMMGLGAIGAIGVAGLGVLAVFQIANVVAAGTGRSMVAGPPATINPKVPAVADRNIDRGKQRMLEESQKG